MKLKMNTSILPLINPGLYGTNLGYTYEDLYDEYKKDFKSALCEYGKNKIQEILNDDFIKKHIGNSKVDNVTFGSPRFYNYENDWFDFELEVDDSILNKILNTIKNENVFWDFIKENYCSYSGFISFFPYEKEQYLFALKTKDLERAVAMFIMYLIAYSDIDLYEYQRDFEDDVLEEANKYGWIDYEEEEEEE